MPTNLLQDHFLPCKSRHLIWALNKKNSAGEKYQKNYKKIKMNLKCMPAHSSVPKGEFIPFKEEFYASSSFSTSILLHAS